MQVPSSTESGGDARTTGMTKARVALERGAAARAVAGGARERGAALGAELGGGVGTGAVGGAHGTRDGGRGTRDCRGKTRPPSLVPRHSFDPQRGQRFGGITSLQRFVIVVGQFSRRAI